MVKLVRHLFAEVGLLPELEIDFQAGMPICKDVGQLSENVGYLSDDFVHIVRTSKHLY